MCHRLLGGVPLSSLLLSGVDKRVHSQNKIENVEKNWGAGKNNKAGKKSLTFFMIKL